MRSTKANLKGSMSINKPNNVLNNRPNYTTQKTIPKTNNNKTMKRPKKCHICQRMIAADKYVYQN